MQRDHLTYEWNDVALLADQRAYTIISKTMLQLSSQTINEIQDVTLFDWTWKRESLSSDMVQEYMTPFQGNIVVQIFYLNQELQQETVFVEVPIQGAWQEPLTQQHSMRLIFYHTKMVEEQLLLELVLQVPRNQPLERSQVLIGQFQLEEQVILEDPWPICDELLTTSVTLQVQQWQIADCRLQLHGEYQMVFVYRNQEATGEQVFVYEQRLPMEASILVPEGLQELDSIVPYYQSLTAQVLDERSMLLAGSGVFCTSSTPWSETSASSDDEVIITSSKQPSPSVVNRRGSRRANLSKYMRDLNSSVETPTSVRNFELSTDGE